MSGYGSPRARLHKVERVRPKPGPVLEAPRRLPAVQRLPQAEHPEIRSDPPGSSRPFTSPGSQAARLLGVTQPKIRDLVRSKFDRLSVIETLGHAGARNHGLSQVATTRGANRASIAVGLLSRGS